MTDEEIPHDQLIAELLDSRIPKTDREHAAAREIKRLLEALAEPEQEPEFEFWPGDVLICKEDDTKVTVVHGNRGSMQLMNGKIAIAWSDTVGGEYTIKQVKEMFYRAEEPEPVDPDERATIFPPCKPVAWMLMNDTHCHIMATDWKPEDSDEYKTVPLYTAPPARKPLTYEEVSAIIQSMSAYTWDAQMLARAIERAHGIGET